MPLVDSGPESELSEDRIMPKGKGHILFVDDEEEITSLGKDMLERFGYTVTVKTSGVEALEAVRAQPDKFDLLVTDHMMPRMTGFQLARELKRIRPDLPIIITTGLADASIHGDLETLGNSQCVAKPFVMRELVNAVWRVLGRKKDE